MDITWTDFKTLFNQVNTKNICYIEYNNKYSIWTELQGIILFVEISKLDFDDSLDLQDFETNYKSKLNQTQTTTPSLASYAPYSFFQESHIYNIYGGQNNRVTYSFAQDSLVFGGKYEILGKVPQGDYINFYITDEDNILGKGFSSIIGHYSKNEYIMPGNYTENNIYKNTIKTNGIGKEIPGFLYFTIEYVSIGTAPINDLTLIVRYENWLKN